MTRKRLGRGLDGMLPAVPEQKPKASGFDAPIEDLHPNRDQPRSRFDDASLDELATSIRHLGVLEPILVRERTRGGYEIVAGERRWRAAQRAELRHVPVFVRELTSAEAFEAALVENLQREDLNPIETARAFARLIAEHGQTQDAIALRVGKDRSTIANALRLLKLPTGVLDLLESNQLSEGHGRALLGASSTAAMKRLAAKAVKGAWSVRETERRVRADARGPAGAKPPTIKSPNVRALEQKLARSLGSPVSVEDKKGKGKLVVSYSSYDELDRLLEHLTR